MRYIFPWYSLDWQEFAEPSRTGAGTGQNATGAMSRHSPQFNVFDALQESNVYG
jgi:hypothetical protein